jgi:DNA-binding MarR family transcriptional regulator
MPLTFEDARELLSAALESPAEIKSSPFGDAEIEADGQRYVIEMKSSARAATVAAAAEELARMARSHAPAVPILVVPEMGAVGADACRKWGVNWLDRRGNAVIEVGRTKIRILGRKRARGQDSDEYGVNPFSRKASLIIHLLLLDPNRDWDQSNIADETGMDRGSVSRLVGELVRQRYVERLPARGRNKRIRVVKPGTLLDAWFERARPIKSVSYGLVAARDGFASVHVVADVLKRHELEHAFTGLPAAAAFANFGSFRLVTVYVGTSPSRALRDDLSIEDDSRGRNVALVADRSALAIPSREIDQIAYVDPIKAYVDLKYQPERSAEAREELRRFIDSSWQSKRTI